MIAIPSIAFEGFSGTAKDVTSRNVAGRNILTVRPWPTGQKTNAQVARRSSMAKITKTWRTLTSDQMADWDRLAESARGQSIFGQAAEITGMNLFIRLNVARTMAGNPIIKDAPENLVTLPSSRFTGLWVTTKTMIIQGVNREADYKLVVKMSSAQSPGISNAWSKTVIITPGMDDDWGDAELTKLYMNTIGVAPQVSEKVFVEMYWLDTETGCTGLSTYVTKICETEADAEEEGYVPRAKFTTDDAIPEERQIADFDMDFSTGAPVVYFDAVCKDKKGDSASSVLFEGEFDSSLSGTSLVIGRSLPESGLINAQSYILYKVKESSNTRVFFNNRGGYSNMKCELFGVSVLY